MGGRDVFVETALSTVGEDGTNAIRWFYGYNRNVDWCAIWVSYIGYLSGNEDLIGRYSLAGDTAEYGDGTKGVWLPPTETPQKGDLIHFIWTERPTVSQYSADHIGVVNKVVGNVVHTIEGNSNNLVRENSYQLNDTCIVYYFRPFWDNVEPDTPPTPPHHYRKMPIWMYPRFFL